MVDLGQGDEASDAVFTRLASVTQVRRVAVGRLSRGAALNAGLRLVTSRWYAVLDDDDTWSPEFLSTLFGAAEVADVKGVVCRSEVVEEHFTSDARLVEISRRIFNGDFQSSNLPEMAAGNQFTINAALLRVDVWAALGGYREDLAALEDWEFNFRYLAQAPLIVVPAVLARYHRRQGPTDRMAANSDGAQHSLSRQFLIDEWLRAEIAGSKPGLGMLALMAEQRRDLQRVNRCLDKLQRIRAFWRRWLRY